MKYIFIVFFVFLLTNCGNPKKEDAIFETDYCGWVIVEKDSKMPMDESECRYYFTLEREKERQQVFVLDNLNKKYEVGDTICNIK